MQVIMAVAAKLLAAASLFRQVLPGSALYEPFSAEEYKGRLQRAQQKMKDDGIGALLLTMEVHHFYFTGVASEFWASPTRPYYLIIPRTGRMTAVVPTISGILYEEQTELIDVVHAWPAPYPEDDGISLLETALRQALQKPDAPQVIGAELGWEFQLRMPHLDFVRLGNILENDARFVDATLLLKRLRSVKSTAEVEHMRTACQMQSTVMSNMPVRAGMTEKQAARTAKSELLRAGADRVPYMALSSGPGGYTDIVAAASNRIIEDGDVLIIDTGSVLDGYFCDFNRNWYIGQPTASPETEELANIQAALYRAVDAGIRAAQPGRNTADVFHAMAAELPPATGSSVGRMGHGVGLAITEWPSILPAEAGQNVTLEAGMVLAIEPSAGFGGGNQFLVHEENCVVAEGGGIILSVRGPRIMPILPGMATDKKEL